MLFSPFFPRLQTSWHNNLSNPSPTHRGARRRNLPITHTGKMATSILRLPLRLSTKNMGIVSRKSGLKTSNISRMTQSRTAVSTASGAILPKPDKVSFIYLGNRLQTRQQNDWHRRWDLTLNWHLLWRIELQHKCSIKASKPINACLHKRRGTFRK